MLTIEEHTRKFGKNWGDFKESFDRRGVLTLSQGLLLFTEESHHCWAGSFPGNYAQFVLTDHSKEIFREKLRLEEQQKIFQIEKEKALKNNVLYTIPNDVPTIEKPIRLWIMGNDDTSYSKFYSNSEEALEELNFFIANEPLEFEIVFDFGFVFTN